MSDTHCSRHWDTRVNEAKFTVLLNLESLGETHNRHTHTHTHTHNVKE